MQTRVTTAAKVVGNVTPKTSQSEADFAVTFPVIIRLECKDWVFTKKEEEYEIYVEAYGEIARKLYGTVSRGDILLIEGTFTKNLKTIVVRNYKPVFLHKSNDDKYFREADVFNKVIISGLVFLHLRKNSPPSPDEFCFYLRVTKEIEGEERKYLIPVKAYGRSAEFARTALEYERRVVVEGYLAEDKELDCPFIIVAEKITPFTINIC